MDSKEARAVVTQELRRYRDMSHAELQRLLTTQDRLEISGPSGVTYQIEIDAAWDGKPGGNLRVFGQIDDGGLRAFVPLTEDFIIAPDGTFIGE